MREDKQEQMEEIVMSEVIELNFWKEVGGCLLKKDDA